MYEVKEKKVEMKSNWTGSVEDFEQLQKERVMAKLYNKVSKFYTDMIDKGIFRLNTYVDNGFICAYIYDVATNEEIL